MPYICIICIENLSWNDQVSLNDSSKSTETIVATLCGHLFHKSCLVRGFEAAHQLAGEDRSEARNKCPTCNTSVDMKTLVKLYPAEEDDEQIESQANAILDMEETIKQLIEQNHKHVENVEDLTQKLTNMNEENCKLREEMNIQKRSNTTKNSISTPKSTPIVKPPLNNLPVQQKIKSFVWPPSPTPATTTVQQQPKSPVSQPKSISTQIEAETKSPEVVNTPLNTRTVQKTSQLVKSLAKTTMIKQSEGIHDESLPKQLTNKLRNAITTKLIIDSSQQTECNSCHKEITGMVTTALEKKWHPEHFKCTVCHEQLEKFYAHEGVPYCLTDYYKLYRLLYGKKTHNF